MKRIHLLVLMVFSTALSFSQVSKSNNTMACVSNSFADRTVNFTAGDFGGCTTIADVDITIHYRVTDNSSGNPGAFGVHEDLDFQLISPTGTIVPLMQDNRNPPPLGCGTLLACGAGGPCEASFVGSFTYVDGTVTLDQSAAAGPINKWMGTACSTSEAPSSGTYQPHEGRSLDDFNGENPVGTWTLRITDPFDNFGEWNCLMNYTLTITCAAACTDPDVPTVTYAPATICDGNNATLNISGNLNDATQWAIYTGSCGGTLVGTTAGSTFVVTPSSPSTTYYVRGEGGCVTPGSCGTVTVNVTPLDDASFNYSQSNYCQWDPDPTPTITGLGGGTFSSSPAGMTINPSTGQITITSSFVGPYTVTYTTSGACPNSSNQFISLSGNPPGPTVVSPITVCDGDDVILQATGDGNGNIEYYDGGFNLISTVPMPPANTSLNVGALPVGTYSYTVLEMNYSGCASPSVPINVTVVAIDDPSFSYAASNYCVNAADPTPTVTGLGGGTFTSSPAGLSINASTGTIDVSASTPNTYTVTYTTAGTCPNSSNVNVTINALDNPSFSYAASNYCVNAADPTPTVTGLGGGTFTSSPVGLSINSSTGTIDVSASTPNTYTVTYTTAGTCPNSSNVNVTINALDNASFSYAASNYCVNAADPTPTITGLGGGTFTSSPAGLSINASTGTIDVSVSTPNTYTVTYTTAGTCPNSSNINVTIGDATAPVADVGTLNDITAECVVNALTVPTATDNCVGTVNGTHNATLPITSQGTTVITWTYDDGNGNTSTQTQNVVINDVTAPVADIAALSNVTGECSATITTAPTATDNCVGSVTGTTTDPLSYTTQGTYTVTWTYDDGNGNTSTQTQTVIVNDVTAPVADLATLTDATAECSVTPTAPTATDNCAGAMTGTPDVSFPITAQGTTVVTWTYDDGNGNTTTQTQNVIITDVTSPVADIAVLSNVIGECSATITTAPTATDNCVGSVTGTTVDPLSYPTQGTYTVTWTYDDGNGNTTMQTQTVIVNDVTAPIADVAILSDVTSECSVTPTAPTATDNCAGALTGTPDMSFPITTQGTTVVTWTYDDGNGNTTTQTQNIIVNDVTSPVADNATLSDEIAECEVTSLPAPTATDNCAGSLTGTPNVSFPITAQGTTVVTWTYDDGNGNTTTQTQNVIITDVTAPVADVANLADINSECEVTPTVPTATDNCIGTVTGIPDVSFPITTQGTTVVTWTYNDGNGNTSTQTQNVTITPIDVNTTTALNGNSYDIAADASGYNYQWIEDCGNTNVTIAGATNQTYTPTANGSYAVIIDNGTCSDTSACVVIDDLGIEDTQLSNITLSPNPTTGMYTIDLGMHYSEVEFTLYDNKGKVLDQKELSNIQMIEEKLTLEPGLYYIQLKLNNDRTKVLRVVKQ